MDEKICPLRLISNEIHHNTSEPSCIRERCAWWCPAKTEDNQIHGACAITLESLSTCVIASYYEKILDNK